MESEAIIAGGYTFAERHGQNLEHTVKPGCNAVDENSHFFVACRFRVKARVNEAETKGNFSTSVTVNSPFHSRKPRLATIDNRDLRP